MNDAQPIVYFFKGNLSQSCGAFRTGQDQYLLFGFSRFKFWLHGNISSLLVLQCCYIIFYCDLYRGILSFISALNSSSVLLVPQLRLRALRLTSVPATTTWKATQSISFFYVLHYCILFLLLQNITLIRYNQLCQPAFRADPTHWWGFAYFRQVKDRNLRRGYFQKVLISCIFFIIFFFFHLFFIIKCSLLWLLLAYRLWNYFKKWWPW